MRPDKIGYIVINILKNKTMTFKEWVIDIFKDERGAISVKPVIAFVGSLFLCGTMLANSFTEDHFKPAAELVNAVMVITAIGMGADTLDKFTSKKVEEPKKEEELG